MRHVVGPFRFFGMLITLVAYMVTMAITWTIVRERWARVRWSQKILRAYSIFSLRLLGVTPNYRGLEFVTAGALYVGNHVSYLDVLAVQCRAPSSFVTSQEIKETPVLGQICQLAGCLFVERRSRLNLRGEVGEIAAALTKGFNVAIFPEATSTNGERVLRFKRPLFTAAERAGRPVVPFCLNYHTVNGRPIDLDSRDKVFWYGDMGFVGHLWALASSGGVRVDVIFLEPVVPGPDVDAAVLAERAHARIASVFRGVGQFVGSPPSA